MLVPPPTFEAVGVSDHEIHLYWQATPGASGYRIIRDKQKPIELSSDKLDYDDSSLQPNHSYSYSIVAENGSEISKAVRYSERTDASFPQQNPAQIHSHWKVPSANFDVVIAQASSGGLAAAIEAARRGLKVALIEPSGRIGGMPVNGLSASDLRRPEHASGIFVRFQQQVKSLYADQGIKTDGLSYEPRVAHQAMKMLLNSGSYAKNISLFRRARLAGVNAVKSDEAGNRKRVESVLVDELNAAGNPTGRRAEFTGKTFIDATDCGDLAAWAGASFRLGREPKSAREPHNGVIYYDRAHDKALPGSTGEGDSRIQAYTYLLTVKDYGEGADKTIPMPPGYHKEDFTKSPGWKDSWAYTSGKMPGSKHELNQHPQGGDIQEINYHYPLDSYEERSRIEKLYRDHVLAYLYYIQTELGQKQIGLPDDEYRESGGFPPLLYVREGRRILGESLPDETDIEKARNLTPSFSIGLGDYPMDSHAVRKKVDYSTPDMGEGEWWLYQHTPWHSLPYGVMLPKSLDNVFVTTAVSSTHVSFGTYRLEPVRMAFGQAAAIASELCIRYHLKAREVPVRQIQEELLPHIANKTGDPNIKLVFMSDIKPGAPHYRAIQYLSTHGFQFSPEMLKPDAPTTVGELAACLTQLVKRAAPGKPNSDYHPYLGAPADVNELEKLQSITDKNRAASRSEIIRWIANILPACVGRTAKSGESQRYADVSTAEDRIAIDMLGAWDIDSTLWDGWESFAPDGKLLLKPDSTLSHEKLFQTLYPIQLTLGPLFDDNPQDIRNAHLLKR